MSKSWYLAAKRVSNLQQVWELGVHSICAVEKVLVFPMLKCFNRLCPLGNASKLLEVIDLLLFKGREELNNIVEHAKQRHHIIGQYVLGRQGLVQDLDAKDEGMSDFLKNFYKSNYF
ncbi:hypothetical protein REPUB_Repub13aG0132900 [Reevesia pubescens]